MSLKTQLHNKRFRNWANGTIATRYLREGLFQLIDETVKRQHEDILVYLRSNSRKCNTCSLNYLQPHHNKSKTGACPLNNRSCNCADVSFRKPCQNGFCSIVYDKIILQHRYSSPNWKNTNIKLWCSNHWEIAKCYMSAGSQGPMTSASKTDCSSLISVIINDIVMQDVFSSKISPPRDIFTKVQKVINAICNSPDQELDDCTLATYIDHIFAILDDKCLRKRPEAIRAKGKLQLIKADVDADANEYMKNTTEMSHKTLSGVQRLLSYSDVSHSSSSGYSSLCLTQDSSPPSSRRESFFSTSGLATWVECIQHKDLGMAYELLEKRVLPSNSELEACLCFGRTSDIFRKICKSISDHIKSCSKNFISVSATYWHKRNNNYRNENLHVVFVAITTADPIGIDIFDYHIYARQETELSREDTTLLRKEVSEDSKILPISAETLERLRQCVVKNANYLMSMHSNLSVILPGFIKSTGYGSDRHLMNFQPCIRLYVPIKGYVPLEEEPFPEEIDGFTTDVVEGKYEAYNGRPDDFHHHLKIGVAIHANVVNNNQEVIGGTLTGFVDHPVFGLCGMTTAHVLYSPDDLQRLKQIVCYDKQVFQPVTGTTQSFGRIVQVTCSEGNEFKAGMEVALFKIYDRHPKDGSFPEASNYEQAAFALAAISLFHQASQHHHHFHSGYNRKQRLTSSTLFCQLQATSRFDETNPLTFHSGDVCEISEIRRRTEVYKFGIGSGVTRGSFCLQGAAIRKTEMNGQLHGYEYCLKNQIAILQIGQEPFATNGDSGALVLKEGKVDDSGAVGMVEGGLGGRIFATPICDILRGVGCTDIMMKRFNKSNRSPRPYTGGTSADSGLGEMMEVTDENLVNM